VDKRIKDDWGPRANEYCKGAHLLFMKRIPPGLVLFLLGPILGELVSGHQPPLVFFDPLNFVILSLPYGCGALICRELVVRWNKGKLSLLLLGVAYAFYEEGIVVRSFFDPKWGELGKLADYNYFAGVNWTYAEMLVHFHVLVSIGASVILAEVLFPERRHQRWVNNKVLAVCWVGLLLWFPAGWLMTSYRPPAGWYILTWLAIFGLILAARYLRVQNLPSIGRTACRSVWFFLLGLVNMSVFFLAVYLTPEIGVPPLLVTVLLLILLDGVTVWLVLRWSDNGHAWDDRHRLAWVAGQLGFFILFGFLSDLEIWEGKSIASVLAIAWLWRLGQRVKQRVRGEVSHTHTGEIRL
jgi:hypothetical protein